MTPRLVALPLSLAAAGGCLALSSAAPQVERRLERTFATTASSVVVVRVGGGPIYVDTRSGDSARVTIEQAVDVGSEAEADAALKDYEVSAAEQGGTITVVARRLRENERQFRRNGPRVRLAVRVTAPANVRLDLDTSGGPIAVLGERTADVKADTSGGPIEVDGGRGMLDLDTSGGPIRVGRAYAVLRASTSGGPITVNYVGPQAREVLLDTSGGSIRAGVDRQAQLDIRASTSGGSVSVDDLPFETQTIRRNRATGRINGGGGLLTAETSGGSIDIHGVSAQ
jgi:hypothetical protein